MPNPPDNSPRSSIRLNRFLAQAGLGSRRVCDELIQKGLVTVNGEVNDQPATQVDPEKDEVHFQGRRISLNPRLVYYLFHKPAGVITTTQDPFGRPTVLDYFKDEERIYPVGRLDFDTTGALLLTNDGELAHRLTHPSFQVPKTYQVKVRGRVGEEKLHRMEVGIEIENGIIAKGELVTFSSSASYTLVRLRLREGRKREIKRMFLALGHKVLELHREAFAFLTVDDLEVGQWRPLRESEVRQLKELTDGHSG